MTNSLQKKGVEWVIQDGAQKSEWKVGFKKLQWLWD